MDMRKRKIWSLYGASTHLEVILNDNSMSVSDDTLVYGRNTPGELIHL